jgi:hypothetical protein
MRREFGSDGPLKIMEIASQRFALLGAETLSFCHYMDRMEANVKRF